MSNAIDELPPFGFRHPDPSRRLRRLPFLLVLGLAAATFVIRVYFPQRIAFFDGPPGFTIYADPAKGWTLSFPDAWHAQRFSDVADGGPYTLQWHGVMLSNIDHHFEREGGGDISWSPWFRMNGLPSTLVAVQVMYSYSGGFGIFCRYDTPLPLTLRGVGPRPNPQMDAGGQPFIQVGNRFVIGGEPYYSVNAWVGSKASKADIKIMEQIVRSISYELTGDPVYGREDCLEY